MTQKRCLLPANPTIYLAHYFAALGGKLFMKNSPSPHVDLCHAALPTYVSRGRGLIALPSRTPPTHCCIDHRCVPCPPPPPGPRMPSVSLFLDLRIWSPAWRPCIPSMASQPLSRSESPPSRPSGCTPAHEDTASKFQPSRVEQYEKLGSYPFGDDPEFSQGLSVILGHPNVPVTETELLREDDLVLQAKCFYYSR